MYKPDTDNIGKKISITMLNLSVEFASGNNKFNRLCRISFFTLGIIPALKKKSKDKNPSAKLEASENNPTAASFFRMPIIKRSTRKFNSLKTW